MFRPRQIIIAEVIAKAPHVFLKVMFFGNRIAIAVEVIGTLNLALVANCLDGSVCVLYFCGVFLSFGNIATLQRIESLCDLGVFPLIWRQSTENFVGFEIILVVFCSLARA